MVCSAMAALPPDYTKSIYHNPDTQIALIYCFKHENSNYKQMPSMAVWI